VTNVKKISGNFPFSREYEWDKPRHDPELHLTAGRRIFEATKEALSSKREWAKHEHLKLEAQWEDLYEKEEKLKDTFVKLSQVSGARSRVR
jgi:hypothetical protein